MSTVSAEDYVLVHDALTVLEYAVCDWHGWLLEVSSPASAHLRHAATHLAEALCALTSVTVVGGVTIDPFQDVPPEEEEDCP